MLRFLYTLFLVDTSFSLYFCSRSFIADSDFANPARPEYPYGQLFGRSDVNLAASTSVIEGLPDEQRSSPVRRTFLLAMVFDLLLCFTLWIIYVQVAVSSGDILEALRSEVARYSFRTSLFDTVVLAASRFLLIEVVYGAFSCRTPWWSAGTTGSTCLILIVKCFLFDFHQNVNNSAGMVYAVVISALILTWIETTFLIYRVIPQEKAAAQVTSCLTIDEPDETHSLLGSLRGSRRLVSTYSASVGGYHTPIGSLMGPNITGSREASVDIAALLHRAGLLRSEVWYLYRLEAWGPESSSSEDSLIRSALLQGYTTKIFRMEATLEAPSKAIFHDLVYNVDQTSTWNCSVDYIECLQSLPSENIDIVHNVTNEALGGAISPRDFVLLRHWGEHDGCFFLGVTSIEHPKCPPMKSCVRAQQPISAFILESIPETPSRCRIVWLICLDLRLYLPQRLIDRAMTSELTSLLTSLQNRARFLQGSARTVRSLEDLGPIKLNVTRSKRRFRLKRSRTNTSSVSSESECSSTERSSSSNEKFSLLPKT